MTVLPYYHKLNKLRRQVEAELGIYLDITNLLWWRYNLYLISHDDEPKLILDKVSSKELESFLKGILHGREFQLNLIEKHLHERQHNSDGRSRKEYNN